MTKIFKFEKLVRDFVPTNLANKNITIHTKTLSPQEYKQALIEKAKEELEEMETAENKEDLAIEIADMLEVIHSIMQANGFTQEEINKIQTAKREKNGGFEKQIYITKIEMDEDNPAQSYYLGQPSKYPAI